MPKGKKPLSRLLKDGPPLITERVRMIGEPASGKEQPKPSNPKPQIQAVPQLEEPIQELPSEDVNLDELTVPPAPRIDIQISSNIMELFRKLAAKDSSLKNFEDEPPEIDGDKNIIIRGKIFGKLASDSEARIHFNKIWEYGYQSKLTLFTNSSLFISTSTGKFIYFSIGQKVISLSCSKDENSPEIMSV